MKKTMISVCVGLVLVLMLGAMPLASAEEDVAVVSLTVEELVKYNGKGDMPAYVAVDGIVYDVTDVPEWQGGMHQGQYEAGQDLSDIIHEVSPHGVSVLENLPVVAYLLTGEDEEIPTETFTVQALAAYTGKDGNPAYIAVDGLVYDVSSSAQWAEGVHQGAYEAGKDYTELIREVSPHGISVLDNVQVVGRLVFDDAEENPAA